MRVALVAPPWFEVPPRAYGGIEAVVAELAEALVARGHDVTVIGAGAGGTSARHLRTYPEPQGARLGEPTPDLVHAARVARLLDTLDVDVVHDHSAAGPLLARGRSVPTLLTAHGPVVGEMADYYRALGDTVSLVAISAAQRRSAPKLPWLATVPNGVRVASFPFRRDKADYALFLGRFSPEKGAHLAVQAARAVGLPLILAGKRNERPEREYFEREVGPLLGADTVMYGEADAAAKRELLAGARCLLFPICWEEPFGMVMIEAMACGTPVVALRRGSVPEVVVDGETGILCDTPGELPSAILAAGTIDPGRCREHAAAHFDTGTMARRYEAAYRAALDRSSALPSVLAGLREARLDERRAPAKLELVRKGYG